MHHPTDRIAYTTAFVTPVVEHWLEREIAQWVHHFMGLLFLISIKGSFICIIPQTGWHIPLHLLHQLWSTGWIEKIAQWVPCEGLISLPPHHEGIPFHWAIISLLFMVETPENKAHFWSFRLTLANRIHIKMLNHLHCYSLKTDVSIINIARFSFQVVKSLINTTSDYDVGKHQ